MKRYWNPIIEKTFERWLETERIVCKPSFRLPLAIHPTTHTDIYARSLYAAEDGDMNKLEQKLIVELTALPNVRWWHRNIARQGFLQLTALSSTTPIF